MAIRLATILAAAVLAGCASHTADAPASRSTKHSARGEKVETLPDATSTAATMDGYKRDLAQRIAQVNSTKVYVGRPQALLRSVVVLRFAVDARQS